MLTYKDKIYINYKTVLSFLQRSFKIKHRIADEPIKVNFGCGESFQDGYIHIDARWTHSVDIVASLKWCDSHLSHSCDEVYISHVLEHFRSPGKAMRNDSSTVLGALQIFHDMLVPGGTIRIAVPDFQAISREYLSGGEKLYHKIIGRVCGEQEYRQNVHFCVFDRAFLTFCLKTVGFEKIRTWDPIDMGFKRDSSFDTVNNRKTSLNLCADKLKM